jgi:hypothetical protein
MTILDEPPKSATPTRRLAGWYVDPQGIHDQRFYDGTVWTKHVTHFGPVPCNRCAH